MNRVRTIDRTCTVDRALVAVARIRFAPTSAPTRRRSVEFAGMLGRMVNMFGGKAAREGVTTSIAVKGDRKATTERHHRPDHRSRAKRRSTTSI